MHTITEGPAITVEVEAIDMNEYEICIIGTGKRTGYVFASSIEEALAIARDFQGNGVGVFDRKTGWFLG